MLPPGERRTKSRGHPLMFGLTELCLSVTVECKLFRTVVTFLLLTWRACLGWSYRICPNFYVSETYCVKI